MSHSDWRILILLSYLLHALSRFPMLRPCVGPCCLEIWWCTRNVGRTLCTRSSCNGESVPKIVLLYVVKKRYSYKAKKNSTIIGAGVSREWQQRHWQDDDIISHGSRERGLVVHSNHRVFTVFHHACMQHAGHFKRRPVGTRSMTVRSPGKSQLFSHAIAIAIAIAFPCARVCGPDKARESS